MQIFSLISALAPAVPIGVGFFRFRQRGFPDRLLLAFLVFAFGLDLAGFVLRARGIEVYWIVHAFTLVEYSFFAWLFSLWVEGPRLRSFLRVSVVGFALIWLALKLTLEPFGAFDSYSTSIESVLLIWVSGYTLYEVSRSDILNLYHYPRFWVGCGVLVYFAGSLMSFALFNLLKDGVLSVPIHAISNIVKNGLFAGAFLCHPPNSGGRLASEP